MNLPEFLRNPGASFEFATWLRKFIEDNLPVWVTNPQQPSLTGFIRFNFDNEGGWLDITAPDSDDDGYSFHLSAEAGMRLEAPDGIVEIASANYLRTIIADDADFEVNGATNGLVFTVHGDGNVTALGGLSTAPDPSASASLALGSAYHNPFGYDVLLVVYLSVTVNTSGVVKLGVGPTSTPTQQTIVTGVTTVGFLPVTIYLPKDYYALLSISGTITDSIAGQIAMPV